MAEIERTLGPVDILVNNAAINIRKPFDEYTLAEWRTLQDANFDGPFLVARTVVPGMKARRRGKIINICSLASDIGRPNIVAYAASKGGLKMMTRALAVELAPHNVQVNGISPGFFKTEMNSALIGNAEFSAWVEKRTPAGRWGILPKSPARQCSWPPTRRTTSRATCCTWTGVSARRTDRWRIRRRLGEAGRFGV